MIPGINPSTSKTQYKGYRIEVSKDGRKRHYIAKVYRGSKYVSWTLGGNEDLVLRDAQRWVDKKTDGGKNPRKGPIASATGLVDKVYQTVMSPVDALARGADKGFVKAVNPEWVNSVLWEKKSSGGWERINAAPIDYLIQLAQYSTREARIQDKSPELDRIKVVGGNYRPVDPKKKFPSIRVGKGLEPQYEYVVGGEFIAAKNNPKTKLDLILDQVESRKREVTIDTDGYTREQVDRIIETAEGRGLHASYDGRFVLVRALEWNPKVTKPGGEVVSFDRTGRRMKGNPRHLTLSGRNGTSPRTVFVDDEEIGTVAKQGNGLWRAVDLAGNDHGDQYTSDFNAAKQLQLGLRKVNPKRNPKDDAAVMYESFHGSPSTEVVEIEGQEHYHSNLTSLGVLVELHVDVVTGGKVELEFDPETDGSKTDTVLLCSNEDGTQLFFVGGNQEIDLAELKLDSYEKELVVIGDVSHLVYRTAKDFDDFEETDYIHELSEDSKGPLPELIYDAVNCQLKLAGGCYKITRPLVGTSPGIED